jgi:uncharacterized protein involved in outer membrane biogenesis|nr:AsmA-like C-terminal region-containing protein [Candidatus Krumholzibacteria bacterium]
MSKKLIKRSGILLAVLLLVPLLLGPVGILLLPKDKLRDQLAEELARATGAEVELGKASVRLWPHLGLRLEGGTIAGTGPALERATGSENTLEDYRVELGDLDVEMALRPLLSKQVEVSEVSITGPLLEFAWDGGSLSARDYQLTLSGLALSMEATQAGVSPSGGGESAPGDLIPEDLRLDFAGQVALLNLQKVDYDEVEFSGDLDARLLTVTALTCRRAGGHLAAEGEIDFERDPHGELDFQAQVEGVPAVSLLQPWAPDLGQRLTGDLQGEISGTCNLKDAETVLASLSLNGSLGCGEGELRAADWLEEVLPYLGSRRDLVNISFRGLEHDFRVDEGKYHLEHLVIDGLDTHWTGSGWIGLDGTLDAGLKVKLPAGFTPDLGNWSFLAETLRDEDGRVNLGLKLSGKTAKPRVGVDFR